MKNQKLLSRKARMKQYTFTLTNKKKKVMDKKQESLVYEEIPKTIEIPKPYHFTPLKYDSDNKYKEEWFDDKDDNKMDDLDDMAFLDAQIEKVQTSHGRKVEAKGKGYRSIVSILHIIMNTIAYLLVT